jgi:SanA protein
MPPGHSSRRPTLRAGRVLLCLCLLLGAGSLSPFLLRWWVDRHYRGRIYAVQDVPPRRVALVFGAGITADGRPLPALADRVWTAVELYKAGKVEKLLMSGDNRFVTYNEPEAMRQYALAQGVPDADIVLDYAGRRTYDTCYRAGAIFGVQDAILVTQAFHLDRALYTCDALGIDVVGVSADQRSYSLIRYWWWREVAAVARAWLDLNLLHPTPVLGDRLPMF